MIAKVIHRTELEPLDASETAPALCTTRSCARIAVVEAHHAALRSSSHSSMKAENWFQLRIVGVTKKSAAVLIDRERAREDKPSRVELKVKLTTGPEEQLGSGQL